MILTKAVKHASIFWKYSVCLSNLLSSVLCYRVLNSSKHYFISFCFILFCFFVLYFRNEIGLWMLWESGEFSVPEWNSSQAFIFCFNSKREEPSFLVFLCLEYHRTYSQVAAAPNGRNIMKYQLPSYLSYFGDWSTLEIVQSHWEFWGLGNRFPKKHFTGFWMLWTHFVIFFFFGIRHYLFALFLMHLVLDNYNILLSMIAFDLQILFE